MNRVKLARRSLYVYIIVIAVFAGFSVYLVANIYSLNGLYSFKPTYQNISTLCSANKSTMILFYGSGCPSCQTELDAFVNVTSSFAGYWAGDTFNGPYFCAYKFNITQYNENTSSVYAPAGAVQVFNSLSDRIPLFFAGGIYSQYYKIGGFNSVSAAEQQMQNYICSSINDVAPVCAGG